jgi:hypothetical protein
MTNSLEQLYRYRSELADASVRLSQGIARIALAIQIAEHTQQEPQQRAQWLAAVRETKENQA